MHYVYSPVSVIYINIFYFGEYNDRFAACWGKNLVAVLLTHLRILKEGFTAFLAQL